MAGATIPYDEDWETKSPTTLSFCMKQVGETKCPTTRFLIQFPVSPHTGNLLPIEGYKHRIEAARRDEDEDRED